MAFFRTDEEAMAYSFEKITILLLRLSQLLLKPLPFSDIPEVSVGLNLAVLGSNRGNTDFHRFGLPLKSVHIDHGANLFPCSFSSFDHLFQKFFILLPD